MSQRRSLPGDLRNGKVVRVFDPWRSPLCTCPPKYSLQPYTGCSHFCLYCYATAYIGVRRSSPKRDFIRRLMHDIVHVLNPKYHIDMSTSSDPYPPEEEKYLLTRRALELLLPKGFKVLIVTKGVLVSRDATLLAKGNAAVTMTITTLDDNLASKLEPGAPPPSQRLKAIEELVKHNIPVGLRLDPIIPFINDDEKMIKDVIEAASSLGVRFVVTSVYKARPDNLNRLTSVFTEVADKLIRLYKERSRWMYGYWYAPLDLRLKLINTVRRYALNKGMEFATCREGLAHLHTAPTCDGSHLIPLRIKPWRVRSLSEFTK
ncbi:MAG: radical SAM protein [Pyrodictiaceae archaeon]